MDKVFLVQELYNNPFEYSSANMKIPIVRAVCESLIQAAEFVAKRKMLEIENSIALARAGKATVPIAENLFITNVPLNVSIDDALQLPRILPTFNDLTEATRKDLQAALSLKSQIPLLPPAINSGIAAANPNLNVDPSIYVKDRRARENELMKRFNVAPMPPIPARMKRLPQGVPSGTIPQPAQPITVRPIGEHVPLREQLASIGAPALGTVGGTTSAAGIAAKGTFIQGTVPIVDTNAILPGLLSSGAGASSIGTGMVLAPGSAYSPTSRVTM
jgi:hypothetical protein